MLEKAIRSVEYGLSMTKPFVAMGFKKISMDSHEDATACYELQIPEIHHTQQL